VSDISLNIALAANGAKHRKLRDAIWSRYRMSRDRMSIYHQQWQDSENLFRAYLPVTEADALRASARRDSGKPQVTTIEIPQTYAMIMTAHTYLVSVFLARNPVLQYSARHGEPQMQVMALEALIDYQVQVGEMLAPFYVWALDPLKYGFGVVGTYWEKETVTVSNIEEVNETYLGVPIPGRKKKIRRVQKIPGYQGNKIFNVRPYDFFPDPRVPISQLQKGEFVAVTRDVSWNTILRGEEREKYFNVDALRKTHRTRRESLDQGSSQNIIPGDSGSQDQPIDEMDLGYVSLIEMYVELVPNAWGLGASKSPEKWVFTLANERVVIEARPAGEYHAKFPYFVQEYEVNGYELASRSMAEVAKPLNDTLSWLVNSHFYNIRKSLNDQLVVDPSRVMMKDVDDPNPGRIIRLKPAAYGTDARTAVSQLQTVDVTQGHLRDSQLILDMMQKVLGVNDNLMGSVNSGGRKTATEVRGATSFGINRLKTIAEYQSAMAWAPMSQVFVQNTQQYYDAEQKFRIAGDTLQAQQFLEVSPEMIQGFFDFVPVDGTMPVDKFALANLWKEMMAGMVKIPPLLQQYDIGKIFAYTAKLAGAKNIDQFRVNVRPDGAVAADAQAGNIVPIGGQGGGGTGTGSGTEPGRSETAFARPPGVGQVPGLGPSG